MRIACRLLMAGSAAGAACAFAIGGFASPAGSAGAVTSRATIPPSLRGLVRWCVRIRRWSSM